MSHPLEAFWARAAWDPVIRARLQRLDASSTEAAIASLVAVAAEFGFSFTADEYRATLPGGAAGPAPRLTVEKKAEALAEAHGATPQRPRRSKRRSKRGRGGRKPTAPKPEAQPTLRDEELDAPAASRAPARVEEEDSACCSCTDTYINTEMS